MLRILIATVLVLCLLGDLYLAASPLRQQTVVDEIRLADADLLTCDLAHSFESAGFQLRYLGGLANPRMRIARCSGQWAARGFRLGWNDVEIDLSLMSVKPRSGYVMERTIEERTFYVLIDSAARNFEDLPLETLRSTEGASLNDVLDRVGRSKVLAAEQMPFGSREFYESLWKSE